VFDLLQHPPRSPERAPLGAGVSVLVHAALAVSLLATAQQSLQPSSAAENESVILSALKYLLPPDRPSEAHEPATRWLSTREGSQRPVDPTEWVAQPKPVGSRTPDREESPAPQLLADEAASQHAFTLLDVDTAAVRDPSSAVPAYPRLLEKQGIEGVAVVRFVVDSTGYADLETFRIVETNHPLFGEAVRDALPRMKFHPATVGPQRVRQMVELPFGFQIIRRDGARKP
jgi:TonB family protein